MRRFLVAGNWKLNKGPAEAAGLARGIVMNLPDLGNDGEVLVCPPFVSLIAAAGVVKDTRVMLGAQTCANEDAGAYTGEVAAPMLKEVGCSHVIVGHSERREYYRETDEDFVAKIDRAHAAGLTAIFCYGETIDERRAGRAEAVVREQMLGVLPKLAGANAENLVLAYEPVWAIGTGETATPEQAQEIHAVSRGILAELMGAETAGAMRILYGGSMKPGNARDLIGRPDIDGGLIGGASLKAEDFLGIVQGALEAAKG